MTSGLIFSHFVMALEVEPRCSDTPSPRQPVASNCRRVWKGFDSSASMWILQLLLAAHAAGSSENRTSA